MQLSSLPDKLRLAFAALGAKNTIPTASQIGITAGAASLTDGFPPLTRTPIAAGGVPPSGLDMNGILYEVSNIARYANAGGGYPYDAAFAADSNVGGYPKGAQILRSDGLGYWLNTTDNNTTDPEAGGAGWVPFYTYGSAAITMTSSNVTLTPLQYGRPVLILSGLLTANLNLIFPAIVGEWVVINNCTGAFTVTCKTASGSGVVVSGVTAIVGDGTNILNEISVATVANDPSFADNSAKPASTGWVRGAMSAIATAAGFAVSLLDSGYIKLPSWLGGVIFQWGNFCTNTTGTTHSYPLAFPNACFQVYCSDAGTATVETIAVQKSTNSQFLAKAAVGTPGFAFFAVGN